LPGNGISRAEKKAPIGRQNHRSAVSETKWSYKNPAKSGHLYIRMKLTTINDVCSRSVQTFHWRNIGGAKSDKPLMIEARR
jgi:hypothetical protein